MLKKLSHEKKIKIKSILKEIFEYLMVAIGCSVMALGFNTFSIPHQIAPGGFSGISAVVFYLTGFPVGLCSFIMSIPWFLILVKTSGFKTFFKSVFGTAVLSFMIDLTANMPIIKTDMFLGSVFGGLVMGLGMGIVFFFKGTTGGTDLIAFILHRRFKTISSGFLLMVIDTCVVILAGLFLNNPEVSLYSAITVFVCMKVIDLTENGFNYTKAFYVISPKNELIKQQIYTRLDRGVTFLYSKGGYTNEENNIMLCLVSRMQISEMKQIIKECDPNAFVFLVDVHEVLGEGFQK